jgi:hypothetical protein
MLSQSNKVLIGKNGVVEEKSLFKEESGSVRETFTKTKDNPMNKSSENKSHTVKTRIIF